jgi:hypothetical protein
MDRAHVSSEKAIHSRVNSDMDYCTARENLCGLIAQNTRVSSEKMRSLEMDVTIGQMVVTMKARLLMV